MNKKYNVTHYANNTGWWKNNKTEVFDFHNKNNFLDRQIEIKLIIVLVPLWYIKTVILPNTFCPFTFSIISFTHLGKNLFQNKYFIAIKFFCSNFSFPMNCMLISHTWCLLCVTSLHLITITITAFPDVKYVKISRNGWGILQGSFLSCQWAKRDPLHWVIIRVAALHCFIWEMHPRYLVFSIRSCCLYMDEELTADEPKIGVNYVRWGSPLQYMRTESCASVD